MQLPPLQPVANIEPFVSGDVKIDPSVAIAPGVILQAASDCQIIIAAGVCIGMGAILHAYQGNIEVESGAIIGAGVLLVGKSKIGANACVGALATILEQDLESQQIVPPASIIEKSGRQVLEKDTTSPPQTAFTPKTTKDDKDSPINQESVQTASSLEETQTETTETQAGNPRLPEKLSPDLNNKIYGQEHVNQIMQTLFPHKKSSSLSPEAEEGD